MVNPHDHNNDEMAKLLYAIEKRTTPALIIAEIESLQLKEYVANRISFESSQPFEHHQVDVSQIGPQSLATWLVDQFGKYSGQGTPIHSIIHLTGFQYCLEKNGQFFPELNFEREVIFRDVPGILIFYVSPYFRERMQTDAPDFWDWVVYWFVFHETKQGSFTDEKEWETYFGQVQQLLSPLEPKSKGFHDEESEKMIEVYENIQKLEQESRDDPNYWQLLLPLILKSGHYETKYYRYHEAVKEFVKAKAILQRLIPYSPIYREKLGDVLMDLGHSYLRMNNHQAAEEAYEEALSYLPDNKKKDVFHQKGVIAQFKGEYARALEYMLIALEMAERDQDQKAYAKTLHSVGMQHQYLGDFDVALTFFDRAIDEMKSVGLMASIKQPIFHKAQIFLQKKDKAMAVILFNQAIELAEQERNKFAIGEMRAKFSKVLYLEGHYQDAEASIFEAIQVFQQLNIQMELLELFELLGLVYQKMQNWKNAKSAFEEGLRLALLLTVPNMIYRFTTLLQGATA